MKNLNQQTDAFQTNLPQGPNAVRLVSQQIASQSLIAQTNVVTKQMGQSQLNQLINVDIPFDPEIVEVIGKRFVKERVLATAIQKDMIVRWQEILPKNS